MLGALQLTVLVGTPERSESEVANVGTKWNYDQASSPAKLCSICMDPFVAGEELIRLPCAEGACPSVWHPKCIKKWLCQGSTATCPLCRTGFTTNSSGLSPVTFAVEFREVIPSLRPGGPGRGSARGPGLTSDLLHELIFLASLSSDPRMNEVDDQSISGMFQTMRGGLAGPPAPPPRSPNHRLLPFPAFTRNLHSGWPPFPVPSGAPSGRPSLRRSMLFVPPWPARADPGPPNVNPSGSENLNSGLRSNAPDWTAGGDRVHTMLVGTHFPLPLRETDGDGAFDTEETASSSFGV